MDDDVRVPDLGQSPPEDNAHLKCLSKNYCAKYQKTNDDLNKIISESRIGAMARRCSGAKGKRWCSSSCSSLRPSMSTYIRGWWSRDSPHPPPVLSLALPLSLLMLLLAHTNAQEPPPNYAHENMPNTSFTCSDKATGGYYADPEAGCQMFHVCVRVSDEEISDFKFLCPNDTMFDQQNFICANWWDVDCKASTQHYSKNDVFIVPEPEVAEYEEPVATYYEYVYEYEEPKGRSVPESEYEYVDPDQSLIKDPISRKGKSQDSTIHYRNALTSTTSTTTSPTSSTTTTTTTPRTTLPTTSPTTTKEPSTTTQRSRSSSTRTTPKITTLRPANPYRPAFSVGKPVVSVSTSTSYSSSTSSSIDVITSSSKTLPEISTMSPPKVIHRLTFPEISTASPPEVLTLPTTTLKPKFHIPVDNQSLLAKQEEVEGDITASGRDDPFAHFDWRKDSSGVTASTKTTYETRFLTGGRSRTPVALATRIKHKDSQDSPTEETIDHIGPRASSSDSVREQHSRDREQHRRDQEQNSRDREQNSRDRTTFTSSRFRTHQRDRGRDRDRDPSLREFSNFRYFKTAFGGSDDDDDALSTSGVRPASVRPQRTASRTTRYHIYG